MKLIPTGNGRKALIPLATLLAAGAVAVGSGATFTSQSAHTVSVTAGVLKHTNDQDTKTLTVGNIKPGDTKTGSLTINNNGTLDSTLALSSASVQSGFATGALNVKIVETAPDATTKTLYNGDFAGLATAGTFDLGALNVGQTTKVDYTVSMPTTATDVNQGKTASAQFNYVSTQTGDNSSISWLP